MYVFPPQTHSTCAPRALRSPHDDSPLVPLRLRPSEAPKRTTCTIMYSAGGTRRRAPNLAVLDPEQKIEGRSTVEPNRTALDLERQARPGATPSLCRLSSSLLAPSLAPVRPPPPTIAAHHARAIRSDQVRPQGVGWPIRTTSRSIDPSVGCGPQRMAYALLAGVEPIVGADSCIVRSSTHSSTVRPCSTSVPSHSSPFWSSPPSRVGCHPTRRAGDLIQIESQIDAELNKYVRSRPASTREVACVLWRARLRLPALESPLEQPSGAPHSDRDFVSHKCKRSGESSVCGLSAAASLHVGDHIPTSAIVAAAPPPAAHRLCIDDFTQLR